MMDYEQVAVIQPDNQLQISAYFSKVYAWMGAALALSALVAWRTANSATLIEVLATNSGLSIGLVVLQLGLVVALAGWIRKMSATTATIVFLAYAALTGLTFSTLFLAYTTASIAKAFVVTGGMFGIMSLYGFATKKDLSGWGGFLFMSLIGIIIASIANFFLQSHMIEWMVTYAGIIIFVGLTAYDTQKLKHWGAAGYESADSFSKMAIYGALVLYLDFINLFLFLLRAFGDRR